MLTWFHTREHLGFKASPVWGRKSNFITNCFVGLGFGVSRFLLNPQTSDVSFFSPKKTHRPAFRLTPAESFLGDRPGRRSDSADFASADSGGLRGATTWPTAPRLRGCSTPPAATRCPRSRGAQRAQRAEEPSLSGRQVSRKVTKGCAWMAKLRLPFIFSRCCDRFLG